MKFSSVALSVGVGMALNGLDSVLAQESSASSTSSSPAAASTTLPISTALIPTNISTSCTAFLSSLNTDSTFSSCISPLAAITSIYSPVNLTEGLTSSNITATLTTLCSSSSGCEDSVIRKHLSDFYGACTPELTGGQGTYSSEVRDIYDFLYVVNPFKSAVCSRDGASRKYCVLEIVGANGANGALGDNSTITSTNGTGTGTANSTLVTINNKALASIQQAATNILSPMIALASENLYVLTTTTSSASALSRRLLSYLSPRQSSSAAQSTYQVITPNTTTYHDTGIAFLFLQSSLPSTSLCTSCTKSILSSYVAWEAQVPYALGLSSSPILGGQVELWNAAGATCGGDFTDEISVMAGVLSSANGTSTGAGVSAGERGVGLVGGAGMGLIGGLVGLMGLLVL